MIKLPVIAILGFFLSLSGCGQGVVMGDSGTGQDVNEQDPKVAKQTKKAVTSASTKSISLDELLGRSSTSPWKYYIGPDGVSRQDISGVEWVVLEGGQGKVLTQAMISQKLRRYVIKGNFDLGGKTIKMPYGSVLDLESGSLSNGTLVFDDTRVTPIYCISKETKISKVKVSGTYYETLVDLWGAVDEPLFPWDTTAPEKVYVVDLKKFGITPGYQSKRSDGHYSDSQYDLMYRNGVGFTNAIRWAYDNGYDGIRFPKNDYCFTPRTVGDKNSPLCGQVLVQDLDKFDIDLGGGSYYNILDSSHKSKYYKAEGPEYDQRSYMFWMSCCINVQIHDGILVGDRKLREYKETKERNQEQTYGIVISGYCYNTRAYRIDASCFMGCGMTMHQSGRFFNDYDSAHSTVGTKFFKEEAKPGYNGNKKSLISEYIDYSGLYPINMGVSKKLKELKFFSVNNNRGYTRIPDMYLNVDVLTFNKSISTEKPLRTIHSSYLERFQLNENETGVRFQFYYDDGIISEGVKHKMAISDVITSDCVIEHCNIHDNHKGGLSGGCNRTVIRHCSFSMNDTEKNYSGKTIPLFLVGGTNFQINYEDSFCKSLEIYHNSFNRNGNNSIGKILIGALVFTFHDNTTDCRVSIYNNLLADIHDNSFSDSSLYFSRWVLSSNSNNQNVYGCKYLTRTAIFKNNNSSSIKNLDTGYRTLAFIEY